MAGRQQEGVKGKKYKDLKEEVRALASLYIEPEYVTEGAQALLCDYFKDFIQNLLLKVRMRQQLRKNFSQDDYKGEILQIIQNDDKLLYKAIKTYYHDMRYRIYEDAKKKDEDTKEGEGEKGEKTQDKDDQNDDDYNNDEDDSL